MQTVLITGAASGIGRDAARLFARAGWQCVLVDRNAEALDEVGRGLAAPASGLLASGSLSHQMRAIDLTDPMQVASLAEGTPTLDAIVNNAGMSDTSNVPLAEQPPEQLQRLLALNLAVPAAVVDACGALLKPGARVVNVSSGAGLHAIPSRGAYSPSKAGVIAQTLALAAARPELCATVLCPGFVRTDLVEGLIRAGRLDPAAAVTKIPLGRMAAPEELGRALFFLASPGAAALRGQRISVDGGSSIYGGSRAFAPARLAVLPFELPTQLAIEGGGEAPWRGVAPASVAEPHYAACLDLSPLAAPAAGLLQAVHAAGVRFAAAHPQQASLTVLLPTPKPGRWQDAGDFAAARMLVSTFACEWGDRALRINALQVPMEGFDAAAMHPLLRYVSGAGAQYLTGQTLVCQGGA